MALSKDPLSALRVKCLVLSPKVIGIHLGLVLLSSLEKPLASREAPWPSGRASDSGARGRGFDLTQVAVLCPWARYIYLPKSTGNTQEAVAPSRHD